MTPAIELVAHVFRTVIQRSRRNVGVAASIILSLGVAIGSSAAVFSFEQAVDFASLPYADADRLVAIEFLRPPGGFCGRCRAPVRDALLQRIRTIPGLELVAPYRASGFALRDEVNAEYVRAIEAGPDFFDALGVKPLLGRTIQQDDLRSGADPAFVASHQFWQTALHGDLDRLGRSVSVIADGDGRVRQFRLVGVMPERFDFPPNAAMWVTPFSRDNGAWLIGKIRSGFDPASIQVAAEQLLASAADDDPTLRGGTVKVTAIRQSHHAWLGLTNRRFLLAGVSVLTLVLACTNIVTLLLWRVVTMRGELATRLALGATSTRLLRDLLVELSALGLLGATAGILVARLMLALLTRHLELVVPLRINSSAVAFGLGLGLLIACVVCAVVAFSLSESNFLEPLRSAPMAGNRRIGLVRSAAILLQVGGAVMLLSLAAQAVEEFIRVSYRELGFDPAPLLTVSFPSDPSADRATIQLHADSIRQVVLGDAARFGTVPGVTASAVQALPSNDGVLFAPSAGDQATSPWAQLREISISPNYFSTIGVALGAGRGFVSSDREGSGAVAIVTESGARQLWPGQNAVGKSIVVRRQSQISEQVTIVGVVRDFGSQSVDGVDSPSPVLYRPFRQLPSSSRSYWLRSRSEPRTAVPGVLQAIGELRPSLPRARYPTIGILSEQLRRNAADPRRNATALAALALAADLLAAIGIAGIVAHVVSQRTREIAIRIALGAPQTHVLALVAGRTTLVGISGVGLGALTTFVANRVLVTLQSGVGAPRAAVVAMCGGLAVAVVIMAALVPAMNVLRLRPTDALKAA
jgi:predicted permease